MEGVFPLRIYALLVTSNERNTSIQQEQTKALNNTSTMVVNRKQPAAPVPLIQSRSASQQPTVMRKKHSKPTPTNGIINNVRSLTAYSLSALNQHLQSHKSDEHAPSKIPAQNSEPRPRKVQYFPIPQTNLTLFL